MPLGTRRFAMEQASDREEEEQASYLATSTTSHITFGSDLEVAASVCQLGRSPVAGLPQGGCVNPSCLKSGKGKSPPCEPFLPAASSLIHPRWWRLSKPESQWHEANPPLIAVPTRSTKGGGRGEGESGTQTAN